MHKPDSVLENEICKILWDLLTETDHRILNRKPNQEIISNKNKRTSSSGCCRSRKKARALTKDKDLAGELKKIACNDDGGTNCSRCFRNGRERAGNIQGEW